MRTFATIAIAGVLSLALVWLPVPAPWLYAFRWVYYIPTISVSARHGSIAGMFAGVAASILFALIAASKGMGEIAWYSLLAPDLAAAGLFGGKILDRWPRSRRSRWANGAGAWPARGRTSGPANTSDLDSLVSIESAAELLAENDTSADVRRELAGIISTECAHLSASILSLLRQDRSGAPSEFVQADLKVIIDAAVRDAEFVVLGHGAVVHKEVANDLPPIRCNPDQIRNVLMFLTVNAVESASKGKKVVLNAHPEEAGVALQIRDLGNGSFMSRVAKRFFGSQLLTDPVGLASAYDIVRQHGGRIESKLDEGKGLEFSVWLPPRGDCVNGGWSNPGGGG